MPFRIGRWEPASNLFLAPLAGYTNLPFRLIIREIGGAGLCTSDLINARSLIEKNPKALQLIQSCPQDRPLAVQLFGAVMEEMRDAALFLESQGVNVVDVNMGCPVRKVCKVGGGSAMMTEHAKTAQLVGMMVSALKIPVTCKMRLGWDDENITAPDLARALEDVGAAAVTVHGRTRQQGFKGRVRLDGIRAVVQAVRCIPVIGNGDITTPQAAKIMFEQTGCAAVSIGRGAFYNPWIFRHTQHFLSTGELLPEPSFEDRIAVMTRHLDRMVEVFGETTGCRMFRKTAAWYSRRLGSAAEFNRQIVKLRLKAEFPAIIAAYREWRRRVLDKNRQPGLRDESPSSSSVFDRPEPAVGRCDAIPVPAGPNELW